MGGAGALEGMMLRSAAAVGTAIVLSACGATGVTKYVQEDVTKGRQDIGHHFWAPASERLGIRSCDKPGPTASCNFINNIGFTVTDIVAQRDGAHYSVRLDNSGEVRYVPMLDNRHKFLEEAPQTTAQKAADDCKRRGQPTIGMTEAQAKATCWGEPDHINRTQTAAAISDQFVYEGRKYLYFVDDRLTSIQLPQ
jgi:hypothetical protein